jgi:hypothetical protein
MVGRLFLGGAIILSSIRLNKEKSYPGKGNEQSDKKR